MCDHAPPARPRASPRDHRVPISIAARVKPDVGGEFGAGRVEAAEDLHRPVSEDLLDAGVVDEVRMRVCPVSRGNGTRVFEDRHDLKVVEATAFENGLALLRYEIKK